MATYNLNTEICIYGAQPTYLDDLIDVVISAPQIGDELIFDGINWINSPPGSQLPIQGISSQVLGITGSASGSVLAIGASSQSLAITGVSAGVIQITGASSQLLSIAGTAAGAVAIVGTSTATLAITGSAAGSIGAVAIGNSSATLAITGTVAGTVRVAAASARVLAITGTSAGTVRVTGSTSQTLAITGTAAGSLGGGRIGASSATLTITGTAAGVTAPLWTPADITGAIWFDSTDTAGITLISGNKVQNWSSVDRSVNLTQTNGANQGTWAAGQGVYMSRSHFLTSTYAQMSNSVTTVCWSSDFAPPANDVGALYAFSPLNDSSPDPSFAANMWNTYVIPGQLSFDSSNPGAGKGTITYDRVNGTPKATGSPLAVAQSQKTIVATERAGFNDGAGQPMSNRFFQLNRYLYGSYLVQGEGYYYDIVICPSILPIGDTERLEGYIAHKWGIAASLPGGHPYKLVPPTKLIGASSQTLAITGTATGTVPVAGSSSQTLSITGTAAGVVQEVIINTGVSSRALAITGSAAGTIRITVSSAQTLTITGSAAGAVRVTGASTQALAVTGIAAGTSGGVSLPAPTLYLRLTTAAGTADSSANAWTVTSVGSPFIETITTPIGSSALRVGSGGAASYLEIADNSALNPGTADWSMTCFVRFSSSDPDYPAFFSKGSYQSSAGAFAIGGNFAGSPFMVGGGISNPWRDANGGSVATGTFYRVCAIKSGNDLDVYLGETVVATIDATGVTFTNSHVVRIAADLVGDSPNRLDGYITDIAYIVGTALTPTQITYLQTNAYSV
jgi:hypothetical protein